MWESDPDGFLLQVYRKSPFESVRRAALDVSANLGGSAATLGEMVKNESNPDQRRMIVRALADIESDESVAILARIAKNDPSHSVRREAVSALGSMDTPSAKKALRDLLNEPDE
jgi:HEAT repeat protein